MENYSDYSDAQIRAKILELQAVQEERAKKAAAEKELDELAGEILVKVEAIATKIQKHPNEVWKKITPTEFLDWVYSGAASTRIEEYEPRKIYNRGKKVDFRGSIYVSEEDNNSFSPDNYPGGWTKLT